MEVVYQVIILLGMLEEVQKTLVNFFIEVC